ncbi:type II secretion system minor pseudopilin GspJ [Methylosoma difficile]
MNARQSLGFTLLELLIAIAVFAIMSVMTYAGLRILLDTKAATTEKSAQLEALQMTLYLLNEDLSQIAPRPVRDEYGMSEPAFSSNSNNGNLLTLTRTVPLWSKYQTGSQLQRVSYRLEKGELYRLVWNSLDRTQQSEFQRRKLMKADQIQLRFFNNAWADLWLAEGDSVSIPQAIEVRINTANDGIIPRLFYLHE